VPAAVAERFTRERHDYYFPDGHLAFRDRGRQLIAVTDNTAVVASLIEIARAREWSAITVGGSEAFRRESWRQGALHGLEVKGYEPSREEQAALIRAKARLQEGARDTSAPSEVGGDRVEEGTRRGPRRAPAPEEIITGTLLDHGRDHYQFDPTRKDFSYFVRVQTAEGPRVVWGLDLERAVTQSLSQPQIGDEIAMRRVGADPVTVRREKRGPDGEVLSDEPLETQRWRWRLERTDFFADRETLANVLRNPSISPQRAIRDRPELAGTYLQLRAAELAAGMFQDAQNRERFVAVVRGALADSVARGDPLETVRLRERRATPEAERDPEPPSVHG
jgi:hypothetical protein